MWEVIALFDHLSLDAYAPSQSRNAKAREHQPKKTYLRQILPKKITLFFSVFSSDLFSLFPLNWPNECAIITSDVQAIVTATHMMSIIISWSIHRFFSLPSFRHSPLSLLSRSFRLLRTLCAQATPASRALNCLFPLARIFTCVSRQRV